MIDVKVTVLKIEPKKQLEIKFLDIPTGSVYKAEGATLLKTGKYSALILRGTEDSPFFEVAAGMKQLCITEILGRLSSIEVTPVEDE